MAHYTWFWSTQSRFDSLYSNNSRSDPQREVTRLGRGVIVGSSPSYATNTVYFDNVLYGAHKNRSRPRGVDQLVDRVLWEHEAAGSSPVTPTFTYRWLAQLVRALA